MVTSKVMEDKLFIAHQDFMLWYVRLTWSRFGVCLSQDHQYTKYSICGHSEIRTTLKTRSFCDQVIHIVILLLTSCTICYINLNIVKLAILGFFTKELDNKNYKSFLFSWNVWKNVVFLQHMPIPALIILYFGFMPACDHASKFFH